MKKLGRTLTIKFHLVFQQDRTACISLPHSEEIVEILFDSANFQFRFMLEFVIKFEWIIFHEALNGSKNYCDFRGTKVRLPFDFQIVNITDYSNNTSSLSGQ